MNTKKALLVVGLGVGVLVVGWMVSQYGGLAGARIPTGGSDEAGYQAVCQQSCADFAGPERDECLVSCSQFVGE